MLLAMRNPSNYTDSRIIVDSNNFRYKAIADSGIDYVDTDDRFDTPVYWNESTGNAADNSDNMKTIVNRPYVAGVTLGERVGDVAGDIDKYRNVVASMSGKEHIVTLNSDSSGDSTTSTNNY